MVNAPYACTLLPMTYSPGTCIVQQCGGISVQLQLAAATSTGNLQKKVKSFSGSIQNGKNIGRLSVLRLECTLRMRKQNGGSLYAGNRL